MTDQMETWRDLIESAWVARNGGYALVVVQSGLDLTADELAVATGWEIKPQGACKGETCVPLPAGPFDVAATADRLGMAVVYDHDAGLWALGPESLNGRALAGADAPELVLPDLDGNEFRLSSLRG